MAPISSKEILVLGGFGGGQLIQGEDFVFNVETAKIEFVNAAAESDTQQKRIESFGN